MLGLRWRPVLAQWLVHCFKERRPRLVLGWVTAYRKSVHCEPGSVHWCCGQSSVLSLSCWAWHRRKMDQHRSECATSVTAALTSESMVQYVTLDGKQTSKKVGNLGFIYRPTLILFVWQPKSWIKYKYIQKCMNTKLKTCYIKLVVTKSIWQKRVLKAISTAE